MKNRCMYLGKQVHPFDKTGACIWGNRCTHSGDSFCSVGFLLGWICNPTVMSISIFNA